MKSREEQLKSRGYLSDDSVPVYDNLSVGELSAMLGSPEPLDRTAAAKILSRIRDPEMIAPLCEALTKENRLYSKIAISEALEAYGLQAIGNLIPLLGRIGNNQHREISLADIGKKTYPLPRDIAARIIIRAGDAALPSLERVLETGDSFQIPEAIDAIGHIAYHSGNNRSENALFMLLDGCTDIIRWKIIRAFQSFYSERVVRFLTEILENEESSILRKEAERSLEQIKKQFAGKR